MDENFELMLAEEKAIAKVQGMAVRLLRAKDISQSELAINMGVTAGYISQLFGDEPKNLTIKNAAKLFFHLGETLEFRCERIDQMNEQARRAKANTKAKYDILRQNTSWDFGNENSDCEVFLDTSAA